MLRAIVVAVLTLATGSTLAQEVLDNSGDNVAPEELEATLSSVSLAFVDPLSTEFRGLFRSREGMVCGEVNGKDDSGADLGFIPFGYNTYRDTVTILPDPTSLESAADAATLSEGGCTWIDGRFEKRNATQ